MITEDYVSFETAKHLKEKGFDEKCQKVYMHNGQLLWAQIFMEGESFVDNKCIEAVANYNDWITYTQGEYAYLCPTLQMAMKWLEQVHGIHLNIIYDKICDKGYWGKGHWTWNNEEYNSHEKACEAACIYALKNFI